LLLGQFKRLVSERAAVQAKGEGEGEPLDGNAGLSRGRTRGNNLSVLAYFLLQPSGKLLPDYTEEYRVSSPSDKDLRRFSHDIAKRGEML
jgi:hypothetical protein